MLTLLVQVCVVLLDIVWWNFSSSLFSRFKFNFGHHKTWSKTYLSLCPVFINPVWYSTIRNIFSIHMRINLNILFFLIFHVNIFIKQQNSAEMANYITNKYTKYYGQSKWCQNILSSVTSDTRNVCTIMGITFPQSCVMCKRHLQITNCMLIASYTHTDT